MRLILNYNLECNVHALTHTHTQALTRVKGFQSVRGFSSFSSFSQLVQRIQGSAWGQSVSQCSAMFFRNFGEWGIFAVLWLDSPLRHDDDGDLLLLLLLLVLRENKKGLIATLKKSRWWTKNGAKKHKIRTECLARDRPANVFSEVKLNVTRTQEFPLTSWRHPNSSTLL